MLQHFETVYFHTSAPSADHHAKTPLGNAFRCFRILPFPIQVNAMFFEFIGIAHKKSPFTNCPVKGVHITIHRRTSVPLSLQKGASFCKHSFSATFPSCSFNVYENIFRFTPTLLEDCTVPRIRSGFLLSKDKVLSLLATSLLNRNPYGFPINGSPVF